LPPAAADLGALRSGSVTFESGTFGGLNKPAKGGMFGMLSGKAVQVDTIQNPC
jgi:hypothetical protein